MALCKAKAKVQRETKAKVKKEVVVRSELEKVEGSKKHSWEDEEAEILVRGQVEGEGGSHVRLLRKEGEKMFLEDGGQVGQGMLGMP